MTPSSAVADFIRAWEGCRLSRYLDSAGRPTIGVGHLLADNDPSILITHDEADQLFAGDLDERALGVDTAVRVPLAQNQFDALCSFAFNLGVHALLGSTLLKFVNASQFDKAATQFPLWDHAGGQDNAGLLKRRVAEMHMFTSSDYSARP